MDDQSEKSEPQATYKVGYGKPPKEHQFGQRKQPNRTKRAAAAPESSDIAAFLDQPMQVKLNGRKLKMHPHEAMLYGLYGRVLKGEVGALKALLAEFKKAGLLEPPAAAPSSGVIKVPKGVPGDLANRLIRTGGAPPWDEELYYQLKAEYEHDLTQLAG